MQHQLYFCNIQIKHLQYATEIYRLQHVLSAQYLLAAWANGGSSTWNSRSWRGTQCHGVAEIAGVELIGGTDLCSDYDRRMEAAGAGRLLARGGGCVARVGAVHGETPDCIIIANFRVCLVSTC
jgi:hypothetical protein